MNSNISTPSPCPNVVIFGDCALHASCNDIPHVAAFGLASWLSIASSMSSNFSNCTEDVIQSMSVSNYRKRVYFHEYNKTVFDYLFSKKGDFLIIDANDNRKDCVVDKTVHNNFSAVTNYGNDTNHLLNVVFQNKNQYEIVQPWEIDFAIYEKCVNLVIKKIKENYNPDQIIYVRHSAVKFYVDDNYGLLPYPDWICVYTSLNPRIRMLLDKIEQIIFDKLNGLHIIDFPNGVIGVANHSMGFHPMHYHQLYYNYLNDAIKVILYHKNNEHEILKTLQDNCSLKFDILTNKIDFQAFKKNSNEIITNIYHYLLNVSNIFDNTLIANNLRNIKSFDNYIDFLCLIKQNIVIFISVKDTCGFYNNCSQLLKLNLLGCHNYPHILQHTYLGIIFKGCTLLDLAGDSEVMDERVLVRNLSLNTLNINLYSSPYKKFNTSKIIINDIDYSLNLRGLNIVVLDPVTNSIIDSVNYDSHYNFGFIKRLKMN